MLEYDFLRNSFFRFLVLFIPNNVKYYFLIIIIDKTILEDSKHKHRNLAMTWVDYKKSHNMVPHSWIIEHLKLAQLEQKVIDFVERPMKSWNTKLTSYGQTLGTVKVRRGIFQGDSCGEKGESVHQ